MESELTRRNFMKSSGLVAGALGLGDVASGETKSDGKIREFTADEWFGDVYRDGKYHKVTDTKGCLEDLEIGEKIRITEFEDVDALQYRFDKLYRWDIRDDIMGSPVLRDRRFSYNINEVNLTAEVTRQV